MKTPDWKTCFRTGTAKVILAAVLFFPPAFCPSQASANSPQSVQASYELSTQTLQVAIAHTPFSATHYIGKVEIKKNGNLVNLLEYQGQPAATFTYSYKVTAARGDVLTVKASCNRFGSQSATITVGAQDNALHR